MFAGLQRGGKTMAFADTLIETAKLNGVAPQAWLTDTPGLTAIARSLASTNSYRRVTLRMQGSWGTRLHHRAGSPDGD